MLFQKWKIHYSPVLSTAPLYQALSLIWLHMQKDQCVGPTENWPISSGKNAHVAIEKWHKFIANHWEEGRTATFGSNLPVVKPWSLILFKFFSKRNTRIKKKEYHLPYLMERNQAEGTQKLFHSVLLLHTPQEEIFNLLCRNILFRKLEKV